jgi:pimeloyl-ACP methyl ester carboxylesterase
VNESAQTRGSVTGALWPSLRLVIALILSLACSACAWLNNEERLLIYRPSPADAATQNPVQAGDQRFFVNMSDQTPAQHLAFWWLPHSDPNAPTLLYLHGTFRNMYGNQRKMESLRSAGFSVLAVDYRGWGDSSNTIPSEQSIMQDAWLAWSQLKKFQATPAKRVIYGHSMGSGVAVDLASRLGATDYAGLVLESAFTSFSEVAHEAGWLASLLNLFNPERFDSASKIGQIKAPLLMIHGTLDDTIPMVLGQRLFAQAPEPKQWLAVAGAQHSDVDQVNPALYQAGLHDFMARYLPKP